jgi:hypothetical protein
MGNKETKKEQSFDQLKDSLKKLRDKWKIRVTTVQIKTNKLKISIMEVQKVKRRRFLTGNAGGINRHS